MANYCKYCKKEVFGLTICNCPERTRYEKLWKTPPKCRDMKEFYKNKEKRIETGRVLNKVKLEKKKNVK